MSGASMRIDGTKKFRKQSPAVTISIILLLILVTATAQADGLFSILGGQRVGTSSMTFLKIPVSARAEAMGGAYVALANDEFAVFWNPAGIAQIKNRWSGKYVYDPNKPKAGAKVKNTGLAPLVRGDRSLGAVHIDWIADISYDAIAYTQPLPKGVLGISLASLSTPDMEITTEYNPNGTGEYFSYGDALLGVSYALAMTDNFSWGVSMKFARELLADTQMNNVMLDLGTYYWTGFRDLRIGVSLMNFGPDARPDGDYTDVDINGDEVTTRYKSYSPPTEFRLGSAMTLVGYQQHRLLGSIQLNHPVDNSENIKLGLEYGFMGMLFIRGGHKVNTDEDHWAFGAGVRVPWRGFAVSADWSYTDFGILDKAQRLSFGITF